MKPTDRVSFGGLTEKELVAQGKFVVVCGKCEDCKARYAPCAECGQRTGEGYRCAFDLLGSKAGQQCGRACCPKHAVKQPNGEHYCRAHDDFSKRKAAGQ
jgi:hypothetical protein